MIGYPFSCFFSQLDLEWLAGFPSGDALLWLRNASVPMEGSDICLARQNGFACWDRSKFFLWIMTVWNGFVYLFWTFVCFWIMIFGMCLCIIHVLDLLLNHDLFLEAMAPTLGLARDEPAVGLASLSWRQLWIFSNTWPQNPKTCGVIFWTYSFQKSWCKSSHIEQSFQKQFNSIYIYIYAFQYLKI